MVVVAIVRESYVQQRKKTGKSSAAENTEVRVRERERERLKADSRGFCAQKKAALLQKKIENIIELP